MRIPKKIVDKLVGDALKDDSKAMEQIVKLADIDLRIRQTRIRERSVPKRERKLNSNGLARLAANLGEHPGD